MAVARRLLLLGSTGSIGTQALDILGRRNENGGCEGAEPPTFELVGLSAERSWEQLVEQARAFGVKRIALADADAAARASEAWTDGEVLGGAEGLVRLVIESGADLVLNGLVGSAGLGPTVATLGEGIDLALANKESLVVGGELVMALAEATGAQIIPVDSEHSALHQLLAGEAPGTVTKLVLTASGGPFRGRTRAELEDVTVEEALKHPTWAMGGKITVDSATLMNKGLEVIEAHHLFGTPYDRIDVVVHPQSIVHSYVLLNDGAALAHLGNPDMRVPISYALHHPDRVDVPIRPLDLAEVGALTFEPVDVEAFPALRLAKEAAMAGGTAPCVLNAANEIAVHAFLAGRLPFLGIPAVIEETLARLPAERVRAFETLYEADRSAREHAAELAGAYAA
ncbi:MAG: 1-deoxy-D-xylulose 5-phosphate reductoisomerase [uncultured Solirubrobacteraceae bacterium]|uniref:1-deoxy-D-xylulose 5-phosphate reductoisomerase n=1 Tax=uncultured Solirubrobacteraceae bacterium TaxID=1162706 RepID=A0A6J4SEM0_9ACTN|nr:MAG: 1-deoxy-D-xylulose 5-phosphate reductoisomerase [uncultured Solirubrobacteraceae bacterium]